MENSILLSDYLHHKIIWHSLQKDVKFKDFYDRDYRDTSIIYILDFALVSKKWFYFSSQLKYKMNCNELYRLLLQQNGKSFSIKNDREIFSSVIVDHKDKRSTKEIVFNRDIVLPQTFNLCQFSNITMLNLYDINRSVMAKFFGIGDDGQRMIMKYFPNLQYIVEGISTQFEHDLTKILSIYEGLPIKIILNLYVSTKFVVPKDEKVYQNLNIQKLTTTFQQLNQTNIGLLNLLKPKELHLFAQAYKHHDVLSSIYRLPFITHLELLNYQSSQDITFSPNITHMDLSIQSFELQHFPSLKDNKTLKNLALRCDGFILPPSDNFLEGNCYLQTLTLLKVPIHRMQNFFETLQGIKTLIQLQLVECLSENTVIVKFQKYLESILPNFQLYYSPSIPLIETTLTKLKHITFVKYSKRYKLL
ncbi:hypothetical protein DLAC_00431 [Tieghemostelium lacteum]|uniref:Uncharacterized protein n=1 Tax=Tieghemostelium lacteum TaxID=361077 RepID=A0A152A9Q1_TIELA|nr:hypothetical protein DLAC_00431 [Tieghemostelium lacteum]|eukprot:KYR02948.1 hypothetical protein DLAC_00431 [Tieghemostelium lacteum]